LPDKYRQQIYDKIVEHAGTNNLKV